MTTDALQYAPQVSMTSLKPYMASNKFVARPCSMVGSRAGSKVASLVRVASISTMTKSLGNGAWDNEEASTQNMPLPTNPALQTH